MLHQNSGATMNIRVTVLVQRNGQEVEPPGQVVPVQSKASGNWLFTRYDFTWAQLGIQPGDKFGGIRVKGGASGKTIYVDDILITEVLPANVTYPIHNVEQKPTNYVQNHQPAVKMDLTGMRAGNGNGNHDNVYVQQVKGGFRGTTAAILRATACRWGFCGTPSIVHGMHGPDGNRTINSPALNWPDIFLAQAIKESSWDANGAGDSECGAPRPFGINASIGILQVKNCIHTGITVPPGGTWGNAYPMAYRSTSFGADYAASIVRAHYDGETWLSGAFNAACPWGRERLRCALGAFFAGNLSDGAYEYADEVLGYLEGSKPYLNPNWRP
jgi:hypothetical protein